MRAEAKGTVKKITRNRMVGLLVGLSLLLLCSCGDEESFGPGLAGYSRGDLYALVVYSSAGIGDGGFEDNIYTGFVASADYLGYVLENFNPLDMNSAEKAIDRFFKESGESPYGRRLLVLAASEYVKLLQKHPEWKRGEKDDILLLDSAPDSLGIYTRDISLYGASFMAGAAVASEGMEKIQFLGANPKSNAVNVALAGFKDGYKSAGGLVGENIRTFYLGEEENEGFDFDETYYLSYSYARDSVDFVFPVIGGSNAGLFRYLRETTDGMRFLTCGMDVDQQHLGENIVFSIVKRMDVLVMDFMQNWVDGEAQPRKFLGTLETGLVDIAVAENYGSWHADFDAVRSEAVKAEKEFLEGR